MQFNYEFHAQADLGEHRMNVPVIDLRKINMSFDDVKVLNNVDFNIKMGEVHTLVGGNGAGKSTLMKIMTGVYQADSGDVYFEGQRVDLRKPLDAEKLGICMIFQEFSLVSTLNVAENIFLNREYKKKNGLIDSNRCIEETRKLFSELKVDIDPTANMSSLSVGDWQLTEIAKALATKAKVLVMDEPTSCLTEHETNVLFELIRGLKRKGIAIVYISHRMNEIYKISDRISILADGKNVITSSIKDISMEEIVRGIAGKNINKFEWVGRNVPIGDEIVLEVTNIETDNRIRNVSFNLRKGEVLGIAGLGGSGTSETLRALFGIDKIKAGKIVVNGKIRHFKHPKDSISVGIALIPEDRRIEGLIVEHSVKDNVLLPIIASMTNLLGLIREKKSNEVVNTWIHDLRIKTDNFDKYVKLLSGGNQQKIVFAKWLATSPDIILLDEPTKGIDIGSKVEIMGIIRSLAENGKSVILASSELAELMATCDRILIMYDGEVIRELFREDIGSEEVLQHAIQNF